MVSNAITCTLLFTLGLLLLIDSMHASAITKGDHDEAVNLLRKRSADYNNDVLNEYHGYMPNNHRFAARGVRLPAESILLGKRRLPIEAVLLGRRNAPNEDMSVNERR